MAINKKKKQPKVVYGPASEAQRLILTAQEDVVLVGGKQTLLPLNLF